MMKTAARVITSIFHPLLMPTVGLFLILNSGTYLSLLDPAAKRAILLVMALGTLVFPLLMLPVLYYRNLVARLRDATPEEKLVPQLVLLILYIVTFLYFLRLPISRMIQGYVLSAAILFLLLFIVNLKFRVCIHMAALGGITGLVITLILMYETNLEVLLILALGASGLTGSARLYMKDQRPAAVYTGFLLGFMVVMVTLLVF